MSVNTHIGKIYKRNRKKEEESDPNTPLIYRTYESEIAVCEFLIDYYTSLKLYICYICVPEDNTTSPLMMIKIENIFYLIKIHLPNNHSAPNFPSKCKRGIKSSPWNEGLAEGSARVTLNREGLLLWALHFRGSRPAQTLKRNDFPPLHMVL